MEVLSTDKRTSDVKIDQQGVTNLLKVVGTSAPNLQNRVLEKVEELTTPYLVEVDRISKKKRYPKSSRIELIHLPNEFVKDTIFTKSELEELDNLLIKITFIHMFLRFDHETECLDLGLQLEIGKSSNLNNKIGSYYYINSLPINKFSGKLNCDVETIIGNSHSHCTQYVEPFFTRQLYRFELFSKQREELENRSLLHFYTDTPNDLFELIKLENALIQKKDQGYFDKSLKILDVSQETIKNSLKDKYPAISGRMSDYVSYGIANWGLNIIDLLINTKLIDKFKNNIYELIYIIEYSRCHNSSYLKEILKYLDKNPEDVSETVPIRYIEDLSQIINKDSAELLFKLISLIKEEEIKQQDKEKEKENLEKTASEINLKIEDFIEEIEGLIMQQGGISNPSLLIKPLFSRFDNDDYRHQRLAYSIARDLYTYLSQPDDAVIINNNILINGKAL